MSGFNAVGMSGVSADEMEQIDGGLGLIVISLLPSVGFGYSVTKGIMNNTGGGGGEVLPGFTQFHMGISAVSAANPPRPQ